MIRLLELRRVTVGVRSEVGLRLLRLHHGWSSRGRLWADRTAPIRRRAGQRKRECILAGEYWSEVEVTRRQATRRDPLVTFCRAGIFSLTTW